MKIVPLLLLSGALILTQKTFAQETFSGSSALDAQIGQAVRDGVIPGAVLVIGHDGKIVHRKAYGERSLVPSREPMTVDTIFDIASLTKVVATTPCIMKLVEQGKIRLIDPVTVYLPEFQDGKSDITIRDLMTHFSGLPPDVDLNPPWTGYQTGIQKALLTKPLYPPGQRFVYSDVNFELLGEIVRRVSGKPLDEFAREEIFEPLGMKQTMFRPPASLRPRIAPTEIDHATGKPLRGIVDDPTSRYMGGVAGHAGVFSTASDLARYAEMMLGLGQLNGARIFSPLTVEKFTAPSSPPDQPVLRGLGWDIDSPYSSARGALFPIGSYGHLGYTGTSLWIDPASKTFVILLTNAVHPHAGKNLSPLRRSVANIAAAALGIAGPAVNEVGYYEALESSGARRMITPNHQVETGLDVLEDEKFAPLQGKRVGLITNQTGIDRKGRRNVDAMRAAGVDITALFSPEHGITGREDRPDIADSKDEATGLPVWSLYENSGFRMTPRMLEGVNALVFDIQDVGARFYTYGCTMLDALDRAAKAKIPFYVLDRPNPITGVHLEGPMLDRNLESFIGCYGLPVRHGLTMGELATMANAEKKLGAELHVIKLKDWSRGDWFDSTNLIWVNPSPNMRSLNAAILDPGVAMLESASDFSVGRGTDAPFEQVGAGWIKGAELAQFMNTRSIPGVRVYATRFEPEASVFKGKTIEGVRFVILNRETFSSVRLGLELAYALQKLYPGKLDLEKCKRSIGNRKILDAMEAGTDPGAIEERMRDDLAAFAARRKPFLLYK
ncbi:MAG TPA: exo-beta-N-acetylmuramidase NamZ domain-containing protein [Bryobacteraceae bacterium]|nr:exo-beta-N-acetylmuramidase NamZ domain-containing protein [Bryobacteraceae bacterium]